VSGIEANGFGKAFAVRGERLFLLPVLLDIASAFLAKRLWKNRQTAEREILRRPGPRLCAPNGINKHSRTAKNERESKS